MQIRIADEPVPEGKTVQRIRLIDAIKLARAQQKLYPVLTERGINISRISQAEFEQSLEFEESESISFQKRTKFHRICRVCKKPFVVWKGLKREYARLCITCAFLLKRKRKC